MELDDGNIKTCWLTNINTTILKYVVCQGSCLHLMLLMCSSTTLISNKSNMLNLFWYTFAHFANVSIPMEVQGRSK